MRWLRQASQADASARTLEWVRRHASPAGGIYVHSCSRKAYPEVTGYLVPTLLHYGEDGLAARLLRWLVDVQCADGGFPDPHRGLSHVFDTGQVLRGLLAGASLVPRALDAARCAAAYLCAEMQDGGRGGFGPRYQDEWYRGEIPETIHLYVLPPLYLAAEVFGKPDYRAAAARCVEYYCRHRDALQLATLTHYLGYELEALIDLGHPSLAVPVLERLRAEQGKDGGVRGMGGARWVCAPGLAQLAVCWYKLGQREPADRAMRWLEVHQQPSGGFLGGYGKRVTYCGDVEELSWAAKFFLDAHLLRARRQAFPSGAPGGSRSAVASALGAGRARRHA